MNYGNIKECDIANGPGVRVSLFVSGCRHHCKGCFNAETWDFAYGSPFTEETMEALLEALRPDYVQGFTLLGGEPFLEIELIDKVCASYWFIGINKECGPLSMCYYKGKFGCGGLYK